MTIAASAALRFAVGVFGRDRLDAGEADLAAILQAKAARIDHLGDAAFALRREGASRSGGRADAGDNEPAEHHGCARRMLRLKLFRRGRACVMLA